MFIDKKLTYRPLLNWYYSEVKPNCSFETLVILYQHRVSGNVHCFG